MLKVQVLDAVTANQIAAGEVVEKPASVVKELVENALDAGATKIDVTYFDGGIEYIRVQDNGFGMTEENARMAVLRHATSKLVRAEDLLSLGTLGFRGEALPSIASVAEFTLITRRAEAEMATEIKIKGGSAAEVSETGGNVGTTVVVEHLFFNVPARRKFLKTVGTEGRYINELLGKLALSRPEVAFSLNNGDKEILATAGDGDLQNVVCAVYGAKAGTELLPVDYDGEGVQVSGFTSKPTLLKNSRTWQSFFVNGRSVGSKMLTKAVDHAYQSMIPRGGFPLVVLNIKLDQAGVDVNVHPQKAEVKFSDEGLIYRGVYRALSQALTHPYSAQARQEVSQSQEVDQSSRDENFLQREIHYEPVPIFNSSEVTKANGNAYTGGNACRENWQVAEKRGGNYVPPPSEPEVPFGEVAAVMERQEVVLATKETVSSAVTEPALTMWPIGQIARTFIVAQSENSLYLVDQHAAHERVLYDKLVAGSAKAEMQTLLVPLLLDVSEEEQEILLAKSRELLALGVEVEAGGDKILRVNGLPVDIDQEEARGFIGEVAALLLQENRVDPGELRREILHSAACKAAIKAGLELNMRQMRDLLVQLCSSPHPFTCPHGRPCMIEITTDDLYKMFKRTGF